MLLFELLGHSWWYNLETLNKMTNFLDGDLSFNAVLAEFGFISHNLWADACSVISPYMYC